MMKYWNKETGKYEDEFPAGTRIGWILLGMGFGKETEKGVSLRYSNPLYNTTVSEHKNEQRSILMSDPEVDNCFFMAMEDNTDMRFNDARFAITASTAAAVEPTPNIPDITKDEETSHVVKGSLTFEDNWPKQGDYDMNDVVIYFSSTVVKFNKNDNLVRTTTFTPVNNEATYTNGFGIQLDKVAANKVSSVKVSVEGKIIAESFETGTAKPVLILFSDIKSVLNKPITVVIEHGQYAGVKETDVYPPFNPFIFVNGRSHEVHLPEYQSISLADEGLRGTENDLKEDDKGDVMYYISKDNMPFAVYVSGIEFQWPSENSSILNYYPSFKAWRDSFGNSNEDWYLHPKGQ